ncbi:hypothetical protein [Armatimonas sp.]|uniref:hypothetical protein n=1 Tax=Armatimonas sp. TaxID=1872638 RepID=UPI00286C3407|nr:hypothetical protein [Armatimonas sp.]
MNIRPVLNIRPAQSGLLLIGLATIVIVQGCTPPDDSKRPLVAITFDVTDSTKDLREGFISLSDQLIGHELAPGCPIIGRHFESETRSSPFFQGTALDTHGFHNGVEAVLKQGTGVGTPGEPVLNAVKEDAAVALAQKRPFISVILTDGGFDDLKSITRQARTLAKSPNLARIFILPVTDVGEFAQRLKDALAPLGDRVRIATLHDAQMALRELHTLQQQLAEKVELEGTARGGGK